MMIRGALILGTGFVLGYTNAMTHSSTLVAAITDLRDEVVNSFAEKEDPESLTKLLEFFSEQHVDMPIITFDDGSNFTVGDLRALSVHYEPTVIYDAPDYVKAYPTRIILDTLEEYAQKHGIDDAGMIEFVQNVTNETPKETTTT